MKKALLLSIILATLACCINKGRWKSAPETYILDKEMPIKSLHEFLKSNKIEIVYLNSDSELEQSKWFEFITSHNLRGYHLRLNSILKEDLYAQLKNSLYQ